MQKWVLANHQEFGAKNRKTQLYEYVSGREITVAECTEYMMRRQEMKFSGSGFVFQNIILILVAYPLLWTIDCDTVYICFLLVHYSLFYRVYTAFLHDYTNDPRATFHCINSYFSHFIMIGILGHAHGILLGTFGTKHKLMDHKGRNADNVDPCSTRKLKRDSVLHFLFFYWIPHFLPIASLFDILSVCIKYHHITTAFFHFSFTFTYCYIVFVCYTCNEKFAFWILTMPFLITSLFQAHLQWVRRMFLNPKNEGKWFTFDVINNLDEYQNCRNQSFQNVIYKMQPMDWKQIPSAFWLLLDEYDKDEVLIFQCLNEVQIATLVFSNNLEILAKYVVTTRPGGNDVSHCVEYLRKHLKIY